MFRYHWCIRNPFSSIIVLYNNNKNIIVYNHHTHNFMSSYISTSTSTMIQYRYALYYYKKATSLRPLDARMWTAVGSCLIRLGAKQEAKAVLERAVACVDSEGVATRELARLYREDGQADLAAQVSLEKLFALN